MKQLAKIVSASCCFLYLFVLFALPVYSATAADEVVFSLQSEDITTPNGQIRRIHFSLKKGAKAVPVSISTSLDYDLEVFSPVQSGDIVATSLLTAAEKRLTTDTEEGTSGIIRISLGVENFNDKPLPEGDLFYIDFKILPGAKAEEDSIAFNCDLDLGPNQACTSEAKLLRVVNVSGQVLDSGSSAGNWDDSGGSKAQSCFIGALR